MRGRPAFRPQHVSGHYVEAADPAKASILGNTVDGIDTPWERLFDWLTYFTILSNLLVAVVLTMLIARPTVFARRDATGGLWRVLRLDSVLMITITGLVYNLLLAEAGKSGWDLLSNTLLHWVVPLLPPSCGSSRGRAGSSPCAPSPSP